MNFRRSVDKIHHQKLDIGLVDDAMLIGNSTIQWTLSTVKEVVSRKLGIRRNSDDDHFYKKNKYKRAIKGRKFFKFVLNPKGFKV